MTPDPLRELRPVAFTSLPSPALLPVLGRLMLVPVLLDFALDLALAVDRDVDSDVD